MKNSVKTRFWVIIGSLVFLSFSFGLIFSENSYAKVKSEEDLWKLALFQGVPVCYSSYANDSIDKGSFTTIDTDRIFNQSKKISGSTFGKEDDASTVLLPTYVYSFAGDTKLEKWSTDNGQRDKDSDFNCKQVFNGWDTNLKGLKDLYTLPTTFEGWGYETKSDGSPIELTLGINNEDGNNEDGYIVESPTIKLGLIRSQKQMIISSCEADVEIRPKDNSKGDEGKYVIRCIEDKNIVIGRKDIVDAFIKQESHDYLEGAFFGQDDFITYINSGMECIVDKKNGLCLEPDNVDANSVATTFQLLSVGYNTSKIKLLVGKAPDPNERVERTVLNRVFEDDGLNTTVSVKGDDEVKSDVYVPFGGKKVSAAKRMLYLMDGVKSLPALKRDEQQEITYQWTNSYIYSLYHYYLQDAMAYYNGKKAGNILIGGGEDGCGSSVADGWTYVFRNAKEEGEDGVHTFCKVEIRSDILSEVEGLHVSVVDMHEQNSAMKRGTLKEVLDWFKSDAAGTLDKDDYTNLKANEDGYLVGTAETEQPTAVVDQGENASGTAVATCQNAAGAGALGWIVCPVVDWMGNSATNLYSSYVEPRLKINPKLFQTLDGRSENPTQSAWATFQTIANVVFIILLLIVIFSQLTGVGIDNYGIKRILPKLIVVAILVNLSYLICVICVDLSNILGSSLKGLFDSLSAGLGDIPVNTTIASTGALGNDSWAPVLILGIIVTTIMVGAASIAFNPAILLTLLFSAIGVIISVLFIFVLFAAREAAIVVLTVVSPVAFVCYALPNTKKAFDKWLKAWQGLLLVYPICGLLIGGGDYISRLLIVVEGSGETGSWLQLIVAMVVGIIPIFFIPTLLKGSFAAMGNIGAKVSGIGKTLGGKATGRLTNSGINKRAQEAGARHRDSLKSGYRMNKKGELVERRGLNSLSRRFARTGLGRMVGADRRAGEAMARYSSAADSKYRDKWAATAAGGAVMMANMAAKRSSERSKIYSDNFSRMDKGGVGSDGKARRREDGLPTVATEFEDALQGNDSERATAALSALLSKGGTDETFRLMENADWGNMNQEVRGSLVQALGGTNIDAMKSFAKYRGSGGQASFKEWSSGTGATIANEANNANIKDKTLAAHLSEVGENATVGYSKDEMQLLERNASNLATGMGVENFATTVANTSINSKDAKAQNVAEDIIAQGIAAGNFEADKMGINANKLSNARDRLVESIRTGYERRIANNNPNLEPEQVQGHANAAVRQRLAAPIQGVKADVRAVNRMSPGTRKITGV